MDIEKICLPIKSELEEVEEMIRQNLSSSVPFVTHVAEYVAAHGGKRLRPALTLFASRLAGATDRKPLQCAAAMELFHTATLMHDDVIDSAGLRRGRPSANSRWGNQVAVLVGDFFYCQASDLLVGTGHLKIIDLITQVMRTTTEGEILEVAHSNDLSLTREDYLKTVEGKTAALMSACCEVGGILGNVSEEFTAAFKNYGLSLGIAFQLADDALDYDANQQQLGKNKGTDLKEGKLTLPLIVALREAHEEERRLIKDALIAEKLEENRFKEIFSIIKKYDGLKATRHLALEFVERSKKSLEIFKPSIEKEALLSLADYVVDRSN